ncbi:hypothetical protein [uncultured Frigoribacterium sp.]|uniref:hypothetical protein n=1 Tax=uncultured Frigoribacterium sp. TaxID=335377 RepID=UPI0028D0C4F9|nr:hypothetical protein [uncultured Frigoribacterium sp.]
MASSSHRARARLRTTPLAVVTGLAAAVLMALTMSGTMSAFTASITNANANVSSGTLLMRQEGASGGACYSNGTDKTTPISAANSTSCTSINTFGTGSLVPDSSEPRAASTLTVYNDGTVAAKTFTLRKADICKQTASSAASGTATGSANDVCGKITLVISSGGTPIYSGTLLQLGDSTTAITLPSVAAKSSQSFSFATKLADGLSNDYQGLTATVPLTWTFTA